jgi:hypothetical protein
VSNNSHEHMALMPQKWPPVSNSENYVNSLLSSTEPELFWTRRKMLVSNFILTIQLCGNNKVVHWIIKSFTG